MHPRSPALRHSTFSRLFAALALALALSIHPAPVKAQSGTTRDEVSADGRVTVKSRVQHVTGANGDRTQTIAYTARMTSDVAMEDVVAVLKDVSLHGALIEEKTTRIEKRLSENSWLIYYFFDLPWPLPDSDMVAVMTAETTPDGKRTLIHIEAMPEKLPLRGVNRMARYDVRYLVQKTGDQRVLLTHQADVAPAFHVPDFLVRQNFPEGPAGVLQRLEQLARKRRGYP